MSQDAGQERRRFFRIDDEVAISYRVISNDEMTKADGLKRNEVEPASLANELEKMNEVSLAYAIYVIYAIYAVQCACIMHIICCSCAPLYTTHVVRFETFCHRFCDIF